MKQFLFWLFILAGLPIISHASVMQGGGFRVYNGQINSILGESSLGSNVVKIGGHPIAGVASGGGLSLRQGTVYDLLSTTTPTPGGGGGGSSGGCRPGYPCDPTPPTDPIPSIPVELPDLADVLAALAANQALVDRVVAGQLPLPGSQVFPGPAISIAIVDLSLASADRDVLRVLTAVGFGAPFGPTENITLTYQIFDEAGNLLMEQSVDLPTDGDLLWVQNINLAGLDLRGQKITVMARATRQNDSASASAEFIFDDLRYADNIIIDSQICGRWFEIGTWFGCNWWMPVIILLILFVIYQRNSIVSLLRKK